MRSGEYPAPWGGVGYAELESLLRLAPVAETLVVEGRESEPKWSPRAELPLAGNY